MASRLVVDVEPEPFRPVLRGMLLDPAGPRFLDSGRGDVPTAPLWWPPTKVAAPHLAEYLAPHVADATDVAAEAEDVDVGELLLGLAERHAALGESALAQRCRDAAAQVRDARAPTTTQPEAIR